MSKVHNITDTALWVAIYRADENERPDAIFHDPFARKLAGKLGEDIAEKIQFGKKNSWSFVARTFLFDEIIKQHLAEGFDRVINLAAGLDTRPYRLTFPPNFKWIEVDFSEIILYKQTFLSKETPNCNLVSISSNLTDRHQMLDLFESLDNQTGKTLVISEGLIIYLTAQEAGELATGLSAHENFQRWAFDMSSPAVLAMAQKEMGPVLKESDAEFKFAPEDGEDFFKAYGWTWIQSWSKLKTAAALNRLPNELIAVGSMPEPEGPKRPFPWSGVCLLENSNRRL